MSVIGICNLNLAPSTKVLLICWQKSLKRIKVYFT